MVPTATRRGGPSHAYKQEWPFHTCTIILAHRVLLKQASKGGPRHTGIHGRASQADRQTDRQKACKISTQQHARVYEQGWSFTCVRKVALSCLSPHWQCKQTDKRHVRHELSSTQECTYRGGPSHAYEQECPFRVYLLTGRADRQTECM